MITAPTLNRRAIKTREAELFRKQCGKHGIEAPINCGPSCVVIVRELRVQPITREQTLHTRAYSAMGQAIKAGFARWNAEIHSYTITPAGETWLTELEIHHILPSDVGTPARSEGSAA